VLGTQARLRSGTVVYAGSRIGDRLETGHNVVIREDSVIGDDVCIWSNSVVDYECVIGDRVKIHCGCYIAQFTVIGDDAFLAPGVVVTNDLYPRVPGSLEAMRGPTIEPEACIGANSTILPYVRVGRGAIVGAGSVVARDIPPGTVAYGNPALPHREVDAVSMRSRLEQLQVERGQPASARHAGLDAARASGRS
jgi:acetyltransferase-like isoleucine patch superfamily enzyme